MCLCVCVSPPLQVGKKVMAAASTTLTPVVLELGGKDPMVVCEDVNLEEVRHCVCVCVCVCVCMCARPRQLTPPSFGSSHARGCQRRRLECHGCVVVLLSVLRRTGSPGVSQGRVP